MKQLNDICSAVKTINNKISKKVLSVKFASCENYDNSFEQRIKMLEMQMAQTCNLEQFLKLQSKVNCCDINDRSQAPLQ